MKKMLLVLLFLSLVNPINNQNPSFQREIKKSSPLTNITTNENRLSYLSILESYYNLAINQVDNPTISFNEFYELFYSDNSDRDLIQATLNLAEDNGNYISTYYTLFREYPSTLSYLNINSSRWSSSSSKAFYILNESVDSNVTPESSFSRKPLYSAYNYSSVLIGDIVWETDTDFFDTGHTALIINKNKQSETYGTYIQTIEAVPDKVSRGFLDDYRMVKYKCYILRVTGWNITTANDAIAFAKLQFGKKYNLDIFRLNTSINSEQWYCSELVYAAWNYAGIDIGVKKDSSGNDVFLSMGCLPSDIDNSYHTIRVSISTPHYLELSIVNKIDKRWIIKIKNTCAEQITFQYNSRLCNFNDAKEWKGLKDIESFTLLSGSSLTTPITENWLANSITASYLKDDYRIITYANNLNVDKTMTVYHNIIYVDPE
ncbi:MAG: YiiX/YebB-like N1pC/P60 family cysteine hydrolase [bacterium]|nr:YiiX/YebB-like N1pC/P60 family cysteine hydrolase [bacterium]MDY5256979.1 YiiX/YebB-like N1pC/P60 family cysteine hydrolase [Candidatus Enterosoma sp.]